MLKRLFDWFWGPPKMEELPWEPGETDLPPDDVPLDQTTPKIHMEGDLSSW